MSRRNLVLFVIALLAAASYYWRADLQRLLERASLPPAKDYAAVASATPSASVAPKKTTSEVSAGQEINLAVPFTPQAPHANWELPYNEFCEEASILIAMSYIQSKDIPSADFADAELLKIKAFEEKRFGYYKDTTIAEVATIIQEYYKYDKTKILVDPTIDNIKEALTQGKLVIMPAAGQQLGNPYFRQPGPLYHMLVLKGYTKNGQIIVNDPGTRRGADYIYRADILMNAMHDWRGDGQIEKGRKVILLVG